jgi:hypothetical protein
MGLTTKPLPTFSTFGDAVSAVDVEKPPQEGEAEEDDDEVDDLSPHASPPLPG